MEQKRIPTYYGFRTYLTSNLLYSFLIIPFLLFLGAKSIPELVKDRPNFIGNTHALVDSLEEEDIDSLVNSAIVKAEGFVESVVEEKDQPLIKFSGPSDEEDEDEDDEDEAKLFREKGPFSKFFRLLFLFTLASYIAGFIYNNPFKRYFKKVKRKQEIPDKLTLYCKKQLLKSPVINALIVTLPSALVLLYAFFFIILGEQIDVEIETKMFREFFLLALLATLLEFLFVYYWQKHRVHIRYIEHIFSDEELRTRIFRGKAGRIRDRLLVASGMTTTLPLFIVLVYLIQSLTSVRSLNLEELTDEAWDILIGPWGTMIGSGKDTFPLEKLDWLIYVNAVDSLSMIIGISTGILVSLLYLILFIRWTNRDITYPVKELLLNIRNTRAGETEQYTIVRTNDEIGELAEGYNEMAGKIHEHLEHISKMNRDLEKTVTKRTEEVVMQKEEIEAQKEEIEAQLDMATEQRDTISWQKEQILDSIRYAERIQSAILPPEQFLAEFLSEHFIIFKPRDIVSGDYYWSSMKNGKLLFAAADCTGHGVPGAFLSMLGISSLNEIVNRNEKLHAGQILDQLRKFIIKSLHQKGTRGEDRDGIEIALCIIDPATASLEFAGANRPLFLVRSKNSTADKTAPELIRYQGDKMPIGIYEQNNRPFTRHRISLQKNDSIYLFTDGFVDQLGGPDRKTFRTVRFKKLLLEIQEKSMAEQKEILVEKYHSWKGSVEQIDDILVAGMRL